VVNPVTGDYSRGRLRLPIIDNGALAGPVDEITIAGNLLDIYRNLSAANDLEHRRSVNVPTLRVEGMTVAGA
jgi:PmbA protein